MNSVSTELKYCVFQISHCYAQLTPQERKKASWILKQSLNSLTITKNDATNLIKQTLHTVCEFCFGFWQGEAEMHFLQKLQRRECAYKPKYKQREICICVYIYVYMCQHSASSSDRACVWDTFPYQLKVMEGKKASHQLPAYWILPSSSWINQKLN